MTPAEVLWNGDGVPPELTWDQCLEVLWHEEMGNPPPTELNRHNCETYVDGKK